MKLIKNNVIKSIFNYNPSYNMIVINKHITIYEHTTHTHISFVLEDDNLLFCVSGERDKAIDITGIAFKEFVDKLQFLEH